MQSLRTIHLYLGCIFAPMLLFMAVSGIWQTCDFGYSHSKILALLSTIHTSHNLKIGGLSSFMLRDFVLAAALAFVATTLLGVVMALTFGRSRKMVWGCLAFGIPCPAAAVLIRVYR